MEDRPSSGSAHRLTFKSIVILPDPVFTKTISVVTRLWKFILTFEAKIVSKNSSPIAA
jgi:hypothetical protein